MLAFLGHNALYIVTGLICFRWLKDEEDESMTADEHGPGELQHRRVVIFLPVFG